MNFPVILAGVVMRFKFDLRSADMKFKNTMILLLCGISSFIGSTAYAEELKRGVVSSSEDGFYQETVQEADTECNFNKNEGTRRNKWIHFVGRAGFVSDYVYRGQTQTFGGPAVQGEMKFYISPKAEEGFYVSMFGSNVDATTAPNGAGLELDFATGYVYKANKDLSFKLELLNIRYPGSYAPEETKDSLDVLEIGPTISYKWFTFFWSYSISNFHGVNQNLAPSFFTPLPPNGNSKGSWYTEASIKLPIPNTREKFNVLANIGYQYVRNYTALNYTTVGGGISYEIPEEFGGLILSVNACTTNGKKRYYTVVNESGQSKNVGASKFWVGVSKEF